MTNAYETGFERLFRRHYLKTSDEAELSDGQRRSLNDNMLGRVRYFEALAPWALRMIGTANLGQVIEIGSGLGASTEAFAPVSGHIHCFEIDERTTPIAEYRLTARGFSNWTLHREPFDENAAERIGHADGVLLAAMLEHTTLQECLAILKCAWSILKPGGWICVIDTPNRLSPVDFHTSQLPFFSMLPRDLQLEYAPKSPRADFTADFVKPHSGFTDMDLLRLVRWGMGISYHEFELALGPSLYDCVIADGYEPEIYSLIDILPADYACQAMLHTFAPHVHRAFSRRSLHFILRKP